MTDSDQIDRGRARRAGLRTHQDIVAHLNAGIHSGRYAPGVRLVEADLTAELGVSRGPVREALRDLSARGVLDLVPNRGARVKRLSFREAMELFEIRMELEALAARRAAPALAEDRAARAEFEAAITAIWRDGGRSSTSAYIAENHNFHTAIIRASDNAQLMSLNQYWQLSLIMAQISNALSTEVVAASLSEHREIAEAILGGRAADADAAVRAHLTRATQFMREMPASLFRGA